MDANILWHQSAVNRQRRERQSGHKSFILWFTGLSGSGKSTLAHRVEEILFERGCRTYVFDGDNVRHGLCSDLGFSSQDRAENIRRIAEVATLMADAGFIVITAFISPYRADRGRAREIALEQECEFIEIFVDAPLAVCEQRDPKELYKKARAGKITQFTGIDAPYEAPEDPELVIPTDKQTLNESITQILDFLRPRLQVDEPETFDI